MLLVRFLVGGATVCAFASLADLLRPKKFAGIFSAALSVAPATLALTVSHHGYSFAVEEARSMMAGTFCFVLYALLCVQLIARLHWNVLRATLASLCAWAGA